MKKHTEINFNNIITSTTRRVDPVINTDYNNYKVIIIKYFMGVLGVQALAPLSLGRGRLSLTC